MLRRLSVVAAAAALIVIAPACVAAQFSFVNGDIRITVPNAWVRILQSPGDPETMVFQVPDYSPTAQKALARVEVTTEKVHTLIGFKEFVLHHTNRAQQLAHYTLDKDRSTRTTLYYTATEGPVTQTYVEQYIFDNGYAVLVRCVRPSHSEAGPQWAATFDRGCKSVAASVDYPRQ